MNPNASIVAVEEEVVGVDAVEGNAARLNELRQEAGACLRFSIPVGSASTRGKKQLKKNCENCCSRAAPFVAAPMCVNLFALSDFLRC